MRNSSLSCSVPTGRESRMCDTPTNTGWHRKRARWCGIEENLTEEKMCLERVGWQGRWRQAAQALMGQLMGVSECTRVSVPHMCLRVYMCVCCYTPISSATPSTIYPSSIPSSYCPTPDPALPSPTGPVAKKHERGNCFPPLWGAITVDPSAQLRVLSSGQ